MDKSSFIHVISHFILLNDYCLLACLCTNKKTEKEKMSNTRRLSRAVTLKHFVLTVTTCIVSVVNVAIYVSHVRAESKWTCNYLEETIFATKSLNKDSSEPLLKSCQTRHSLKRKTLSRTLFTLKREREQ